MSEHFKFVSCDRYFKAESAEIWRIIVTTTFMKIRLLYYLILLLASSSFIQPCFAQVNQAKNTKQDTTSVKPAKASKFDSRNKKVAALIKVIPAPIFSHSVEAGNTFGLAKFNVITLSNLKAYHIIIYYFALAAVFIALSLWLDRKKTRGRKSSVSRL